jgi:hypothetical protein
MSEQGKSPFDLLLDQIRVVVREEIAAALNERKPAKLMFTLDETCAMLNVQRSWLSGKVRAGEVPHRRSGHKIYFAQQDIDAIIEGSAIPKNGKAGV